MQSMWKGAISFGLVNVPVKMYAATEDHDVHFRQVHKTDGGRIRYKRVCQIDGAEVDFDEVVKGYTTASGKLVTLDDADMHALRRESQDDISVEKFVPAEQIDPLWFEKSYYLEPDKAGLKPYVLLRETLQKTDLMAVVTVAIRNRSTLAVLRVRGDVIVLQTILWHDEVRTADFGVLGDSPSLSSAERKMATTLVDSMTGDFEPEGYTDEYTEAVQTLVEAKLKGGDISDLPEDDDDKPGKVLDLLAALERSVEGRQDTDDARGSEASSRSPKKRSTTSRSTQGTSKRSTGQASGTKAGPKKSGTQPATGKKSGAKKSSTQTSTAKKSAAKKSTTKKSTTKKGAGKKATSSRSRKATDKPTNRKAG